MTFNGLTEKQAENSRKKNGSNRPDELRRRTLFNKLAERFGRIPVKIYIIIMLLYIAAALFCGISGANFVPEKYIPAALLLVPAAVIPAAADCLAEMHVENKANKRRKRASDTPCKVYRCGNTVTEIPAGDVVKGDYVLLTEGDIVPADGTVVHGDITSESKKRGSRLIRNFSKTETEEDISGEYTVFKGEIISSGYAVIKIIGVGSGEPLGAEMPSAEYKASMICGGALSAALIAAYAICAAKGAFGVSGKDIIPAAAYSLSLVFLASEGLLRPADFFRRSLRHTMLDDGVRAYSVSRTPDIIFADKASFVTDGRPLVTSFTDGAGRTYSKFYEVPYPLGTLAAKAAASNTSALLNRGNILGADPYECAEMNFISERIKNTLELEISPLVINGELKNFSYKKFVKGPAGSIVKTCKAYFDGAGKKRSLSNTAAIAAMAEELSFRGSRVIAYAAEDNSGGRVFIGMITIHEKLRSSSAAAYKELTESGVKAVLLDRGGSAEAVSIADKAVTAAVSDEIISYEKLSSMSAGDAAGLLPKLKIITGESDKETLIELAKAARLTVGMTMLDYGDIEKSAGADVLYAPSSASAAVCHGADASLSGGLESLVKYGGYSRNIKASAVWYTVLRIFLLVLSAAMMSPPAAGAFGAAAYLAAIVINLFLTAASCIIFSKAAAAGTK